MSSWTRLEDANRTEVAILYPDDFVWRHGSVSYDWWIWDLKEMAKVANVTVYTVTEKTDDGEMIHYVNVVGLPGDVARYCRVRFGLRWRGAYLAGRKTWRLYDETPGTIVNRVWTPSDEGGAE